MFYRLGQLRCHSIWDKDSNFLGFKDYMDMVSHISEFTLYNQEEFVQLYHFDSTVLVYGMMAKCHGLHEEWGNYKFHLMNTNFNDLASCVIMFIDTVSWVIKFGNFYFDTIVSIKDFYLTADICLYGGSTMYV